MDLQTPKSFPTISSPFLPFQHSYNNKSTTSLPNFPFLFPNPPTSLARANSLLHVLPFPFVYSSLSARFQTRFMATHVNAAASTTPPDTRALTEHYDASAGSWEDNWGEHMHQGFYDLDSNRTGSDYRPAQIRLIEESLRFAGISEDPENRPKTIVDVGCGIGGTSRYLARKYGAECQGITLSPVEAGRANARTQAEGLADKVSFQVADALKQPFPDGQFDLVWSMESGEYMPKKDKFVNELVRVAAPGGTIIIVTWCHRDLGPSEESLQPWEKKLINRICNAYHLSEWCSISDYVKLLQSLSLQDIKAADWSQNVAPFWPIVIRSILTWKGLISLLCSGFEIIKEVLVMPSVIEGYKKGVVKYAIITCRKPK